ncbi:hypothetical protein, partial [Colwellia sp. BRX8-3]|uniref:hypothetical protein n=1 Tax=Colwellia sp. BRX8-3 TaxID=2759837 RepID=UPI001C70E7D4
MKNKKVKNERNNDEKSGITTENGITTNAISTTDIGREINLLLAQNSFHLFISLFKLLSLLLLLTGFKTLFMC